MIFLDELTEIEEQEEQEEQADGFQDMDLFPCDMGHDPEEALLIKEDYTLLHGVHFDDDMQYRIEQTAPTINNIKNRREHN